MLRAITYFFTLFAFLSSPSIAGQILTATCGALTGVKFAMVDGKAKPAPESHAATPSFFVDSEKPSRLVSLWKAKIFDKETIDKYESNIVELSNERLQAVDRDSNGISTYTLFIQSGTLFYSYHRIHSILDKEPSLLSFVGHCNVQLAR